jgi:hypothetical protein
VKIEAISVDRRNENYSESYRITYRVDLDSFDKPTMQELLVRMMNQVEKDAKQRLASEIRRQGRKIKSKYKQTRRALQ